MSSINSGPLIVDNGLLLCLDLKNNRSYSPNRFISYGTGLVTENVSFSLNGTGTFQRVAAGTVIGGYTVKPSDVVYSYALGVSGCHYHGNSVPIPSGVYVTLSVDYLITGATNVATSYPNDMVLVYENYGGNALSGGTRLANNYQDTWQRLTLTAGPTSGTGTQAMFLYPGYCAPGKLADSGTIYFKNPKAEFISTDSGGSTFSSTSSVTTWKNVVGSSMNGTLNNGVLYFHNSRFNFDGADDYIEVPYSTTLDTNTFTVMGVFRTSTNDDTHDTIISRNSDVYGTNGNGWNISRLRSGLSPTNALRVMLYGTSTSATNLYGFNISDNVWRHFALTVDSTTARLYINGSEYTTSSVPAGNLYPASGSPPLKIGANKVNSDPWTGDIASIYYYNRALTVSEVSANYNMMRVKFGLG